MSKQKKQMREKEPSLRDRIKAYRRDLHGEVAQKFDEAFIASCGYGKSLKEALQEGKDLQKAFVSAKTAIDKMNKSAPKNDED